ncbi:glutathione peroxidase isoform X2 [Daphnia magna]|uniref:glutathione peroxidase isoform X2 n=1 Tax=Daphnia magna TaxID=35525 RepID=UPI001E1BA9F3|nr:glutathione peroxidase isoform X2 [Daphnia magna]
MTSAEDIGNADYKSATSIYDFTVLDIDGNQVSLEKYRNHVCIIVNVASKCGYTHVNYTQLVDLYDRFESKLFLFQGLKILAFPCNQFMSQEPGTSEEIKCFISGYKGDGKFDVFSKINVNGEDAHPLWKYLKEKQGGLLIDAIKWNFTKFVINKQGQPVERSAANVNPFDMEKTIVKYLNE